MRQYRNFEIRKSIESKNNPFGEHGLNLQLLHGTRLIAQFNLKSGKAKSDQIKKHKKINLLNL